MSQGLEIRSPFLDHRLVEFVASLPVEMKIKGLGKGKYILRKSLAGLLPPEILNRKKIGYGEGIPFRQWFKNEWRDKAREAIFDGGVNNRKRIYDLTGVPLVPKNKKETGLRNFKMKWSNNLITFNAYEKTYRKGIKRTVDLLKKWV